ncbi:MAG: transposase domain-containing protein, partial [Parachlamydiaceae bacterium]
FSKQTSRPHESTLLGWRRLGYLGRALGVNPRDYLEDVMRRLMSHSADKIDELLPDNWAAAQKNLSK